MFIKIETGSIRIVEAFFGEAFQPPADSELAKELQKFMK